MTVMAELVPTIQAIPLQSLLEIGLNFRGKNGCRGGGRAAWMAS
jgi:hypothetical protein